MAGGYKVLTADGKDISGECFVLRMQDECACDAVTAYCTSILRAIGVLEAAMRQSESKQTRAELLNRINDLQAQHEACADIQGEFIAFEPVKLPD